MAKKIRKYKISIRPHAVFRTLKKVLSMDTLTEDMEKKVQEEIAKSQSLIVPSAVYHSFAKPETPEALAGLWESAPNNALAMAMMAVTIGTDIEKEIEASRISNGGKRALILDGIARESLEQSLNFVAKLLSDEAKAESCELTPISPVEATILPAVLNFLESEKAGILVEGEAQISPMFTIASYCFWSPLPKSRNVKNR